MFAGGATMTEHVAALEGTAHAAFGTHLVVGPLYHTGPLSGDASWRSAYPSSCWAASTPSACCGDRAHRIETTVMVPTHFVRLLAAPR